LQIKYLMYPSFWGAFSQLKQLSSHNRQTPIPDTEFEGQLVLAFCLPPTQAHFPKEKDDPVRQ